MIHFIACLALAPNPYRQSIPPIAKILGVRVGHNGQGRLERLLGRGERYVGGHPRGQEGWRITRPCSTINCDGFSYTAHEGELIEWLAWTDMDENVGGKRRGNLGNRSGWLGSIVPGMSATKALAIAEGILGKGKHVRDHGGDSYNWTQHGYSRPSFLQHDSAFKTWDAELRLEKGQVVGVFIKVN